MPREEEKLAAISGLDGSLAAKSASVARFVLAEIKEQCVQKRAAHRTLVTKAASVVGLAAVVLGFAATFNSSSLLATTWARWFPAIVPALLLESFAIIAGVLAMSSQWHSLPDALLYNHPSAYEDEENESRIAMALAQRWGFCERELDKGNATRALRLSVAIWLFVVGLFYTVGLATSDVVLRTHAAEGVRKESSINVRSKVLHLSPRILVEPSKHGD